MLIGIFGGVEHLRSIEYGIVGGHTKVAAIKKEAC
jgi:hypothetical protein